ncbi:putative tyrosinase [Halenospora varia]|nr:putative tyrosinase [Halenospora varia]
MKTSGLLCLVGAVALFPLSIANGYNAFADDPKLKEDGLKLDALRQKSLDIILKNLDAEEEALKKAGKVANCTRENLSFRIEFGSMETEDRKAYTDAVTCLQSKEANTPESVSTGAKSRFDDFIVTHILQTPFVHYSGTFLGWHRWYLWVYEQALRDECDYEGPFPYWDWPKWAHAPQDSPIFNGDEFSMGSNGERIPNNTGIRPLLPWKKLGGGTIPIPPGFGGGCVQTGPFNNMVVNLGPVTLSNVTGPDGGLGHNPRCLKRDVGPLMAMRATNYTAVLETFKYSTISEYQTFLQGAPGSGGGGVHGGGHFTVSGDPAGDFYVSPGDPVFYLHHGQIDRLYTMWQGLDPETRQWSLAGTNTMLDEPASANTTLDDPLDLKYSGGGTVTMRDIMSTTKGPFCYVYV